MSNEMIEKCRQALWDHHCSGIRRTNEDDEFYRDNIKVIVKAMRELPDSIKKAEGIYCNCYTCGGHEEGWQKIIDKILEG